jgi:hypothetical protein
MVKRLPTRRPRAWTSYAPTTPTRSRPTRNADIDFPPDEPRDERPIVVIGDEMYPLLLADAAEAGHITAKEFDERLKLHNAIDALG